MSRSACLILSLLFDTGWNSADAQPPVRPRLAVRLSIPRNVAPSQVRGAQAEARRIYDAEGIDLTWASDDAGSPSDSPLVTVLLLEGASADRFATQQQLSQRVLAQASSKAARAYILLDRVIALSAVGRHDPGDVLGVVMAHEIGHLLLPQYSHSTSGIMRADYDVTNRWRRRFTAVQGETMRQCLRSWGTCHRQQ